MGFFLRIVGHRAQAFFTNPDTASKTDYGQVSYERTVIYTNSKMEYICTGICMNFLIHLLIQKVNRIMYVQLNEKGHMIENFCLIFIVHATCY